MLVILFRFLSIFPLPALHALGSALGWLVYLLSAGYRRRMQENMARAGFIKSLGEAIKEAGKNLMELPFIWCANPARVLRTASVENWELVQDALDAKKGVIFLTPHLGCFEIVAQTIAAKTPLTVLYRPPRKAALKPLIEGARARDGLMLAPANLSGVRLMLKALKKGELIGLLPDQVPQQGEGVWANFFGKPAYTMTLPAKMHAMTGAPIILTYAERLPHGRGFVVRFVPFDAILEGDPTRQAATINLAMQQLIARSPAQYFWSYNRYKTPDGINGPEQETA
ncbi:lysophospholipid acyltransferase family protein [Undibacterium parvum]|uniref:Lysophospholipid acyltransferase family protein n=1 Tax=Undibacterium parvum TaxID=401471 RepID=A0A3S9HHB3_9BURK|nr:lysophospholipid acyltransferase family protein [Undibacterium parvum]AZP11458.1 lysophospholipid acyltransferase family protein [Undibacterium parvum]